MVRVALHHDFVVVATVCLISLVIWEWFQKSPIIDVRMFKSFNFASSNLMMFTLGILLFSSLVLMPQFLQTLVGVYLRTGGACAFGGRRGFADRDAHHGPTDDEVPGALPDRLWLAVPCPSPCSIPRRRIDLQISFSAAVWLRIAQVIGLGFLFVPITLAAYVGIAPEKNNAVAGIVNFMRNMGSSVGTSLVTTLIARRSQFHQARLVQNARLDNPNFLNSANGLAQRLAHSGMGKHEALAAGLCQDLSARCKRKRPAWHTSIPSRFSP